jgi:hypothetical protein
MHHFIVIDTTDDGRMALRDDRGHYHVTRLHADAPACGSRLQGRAPGLGFGLLLSLATDMVYRVTFEHVDCGQERTMELIHPETTVPGFFLAEASLADMRGSLATDQPTRRHGSAAQSR